MNNQINLLPGIPLQTQSYLNRGGTFGGGDIVTIWGGANNFIDLFRTRPTAAGFPPVSNDPTQQGYVVVNAASISAVAASAATDIGSAVGTLADAGARTIVTLNLPDLGATPLFNRGTTTIEGLDEASLATFGVVSFNAALSRELTQAAASHPTANIIAIDMYEIFRDMMANPASFGFSNVKDACILTPACAGDPSVQSQFLFWDEIHPTTSGHRLIAQAVERSIVVPGPIAGAGTIPALIYLAGIWIRRRMGDRSCRA
jgi:outer membrane lipase/esterase